MRVRVNPAKCKGYGICNRRCPEVFQLDEWGQAYVVDAYEDTVPDELEERADSAVEGCPEQAIEVER
jgi:ferredoxin